MDGLIMLKIDQTILDNTGKILFNISEQLTEVISLLSEKKPKKPTSGEIIPIINKIASGTEPTKAELKKIEKYTERSVK